MKYRNFFNGPAGTPTKPQVTFHLPGLARRKEPVLAGLNGKVQGTRVHFPAQLSKFPRFG